MKTDKQLAADFAKQWKGKGDEKQETQRFWIQLLSEVLGVTDATNRIEFEKRVQLSHTSFIDAYIPETKVLIEQKSADINLHKQYRQSDGEMLTPYGQAKRYVSEMKASEKPRWIVVCNFQEFLVYDLEKPGEEPEQIFLKRLGDPSITACSSSLTRRATTYARKKSFRGKRATWWASSTTRCSRSI